MVRGRERGQALAEFAVVLPFLTLVILGCIQAGLLAYGAVVAREAAFRGLRAAAVEPRSNRESAARIAAAIAVAAAPGLTLAGVTVRQPAGRFPGSKEAAGAPRLEMRVRVGVPRLVPARMAWVAEGRAVVRMEPSW